MRWRDAAPPSVDGERVELRPWPRLRRQIRILRHLRAELRGKDLPGAALRRASRGSGIATSRRMKITVMGASGLIGRQLVALLTSAGHDVVAASRRSGADVVTGTGLAQALAGAQVLV